MDWRLDETADSLIRNGITDPFIMVAIPSDSQIRSAEYSNTKKGQLYRSFLINDLKPYIDKTYRTLKDPDHTAVLGSSMGGIFSFISVWEHNNVFTKAACFSPAFKYNDYDYTKVVARDKNPNRKLDLYIDNGGIGLEKELQEGIDKMMQILKTKNINFTWHYFPEAQHNEQAWSKRAHLPLIQFFGKKKTH